MVYFLGPNDCYVDDGESYRGNVSETDDGDECLYWNSHFLLENGVNPFNSFEDKDGLGPHNFCRSGENIHVNSNSGEHLQEDTNLHVLYNTEIQMET